MCSRWRSLQAHGRGIGSFRLKFRLKVGEGEGASPLGAFTGFVLESGGGSIAA
jgi:hypothetical protein